MELDALVASLSDTPPATKTASAARGTGGDAVDAAINAAISRVQTEKTASAQGSAPVADLVKLAQETREAEKDGDIKHAHACGAAFTDGMVERLAHYETAAKTAEDRSTDEERAALEKFAQVDPKGYEAAVAQGYSDTMAALEKQAAEVYDANFEATLQWVHKTATDHMIEGFRAATEALQG